MYVCMCVCVCVYIYIYICIRLFSFLNKKKDSFLVLTSFLEKKKAGRYLWLSLEFGNPHPLESVKPYQPCIRRFLQSQIINSILQIDLCSTRKKIVMLKYCFFFSRWFVNNSSSPYRSVKLLAFELYDRRSPVNKGKEILYVFSYLVNPTISYCPFLILTLLWTFLLENAEQLEVHDQFSFRAYHPSALNIKKLNYSASTNINQLALNPVKSFSIKDQPCHLVLNASRLALFLLQIKGTLTINSFLGGAEVSMQQETLWDPSRFVLYALLTHLHIYRQPCQVSQ